MYYKGDLQSGIQQAIKLSKLIACFITDDSEESTRWQDDYLKDNEAAEALRAKAVLLRLPNGSQEAAYFKEYYPVHTVPSLYIIHNGRLVRGFHAGTQQDVKAALLEILKIFPTPPTSTATTSHITSETGTASSEAAGNRLNEDALPTSNEASPLRSRSLNDSVTDSEVAETEMNGDADSSQPLASSITRDTAVERLLTERRLRLEKQKEAREANEKAERKARAEARNAASAVKQASTKGEQANWASQQRKRKAEAKLERERILRDIEHDRQKRRERNELRKALSQSGTEERSQDSAKDTEASKPCPSSEKHDCSLQVRLLNGAIIRKRFRADQEFVESVRPWIDEARTDGNIPYTVKMVLSPFPNKVLTESDEKQSLHDLQLASSSTLTLVAVQDFVTAYPKNQSFLSRCFYAFYDAIALFLIFVMSSTGTVLRLGQGRSSQQQPNANGEMIPTKAGHHDERSSATSDSKIRIRTLHDQRRHQEKNEFYNGNQQLNFEPRRDGDEDKS